jgi:hypothetical protein
MDTLPAARKSALLIAVSLWVSLVAHLCISQDRTGCMLQQQPDHTKQVDFSVIATGKGRTGGPRITCSVSSTFLCLLWPRNCPMALPNCKGPYIGQGRLNIKWARCYYLLKRLLVFKDDFENLATMKVYLVQRKEENMYYLDDFFACHFGFNIQRSNTGSSVL